ncbi:hypothetical protein HGRIS_013892 [Hohenbuehelia grisea]|uniref:DUF6699 domain-containing protein n=1 Tax=Hohenbuehelia grisea TaxID=104357 RepID=A0ABR3IWS5_9AGAR
MARTNNPDGLILSGLIHNGLIHNGHHSGRTRIPTYTSLRGPFTRDGAIHPQHSQQATHPCVRTGPINARVPPSEQYPSLNPLLAADVTMKRLDMRKPPVTQPLESRYIHLKEAPALDAAQCASPNTMRLVFRDLPWAVLVRASPGKRLTCRMVWDQLYLSLQKPVKDSEWGALHCLDEGAQCDNARRAAAERGSKSAMLSKKYRQEPIRRVDFLGPICYFAGLERDDEFVKIRTLPGSEPAPDTWVVKMKF